MKRLSEVKQVRLVVVFVLLAISTTSVFARDQKDSLVMQRLFSYGRNYTVGLEGYSTNLYVKHRLTTIKRNAGLWLVPHMYALANGEREFVSEQYGKLQFSSSTRYTLSNQASSTTVPHNSAALRVMRKFTTPLIYSPQIFSDHVLSPFHQANKIYYYYNVKHIGSDRAIVSFRPRFVNNTQLITGRATIDSATGRVVDTTFDGEYDMLRFTTKMTMGTERQSSQLPVESFTKASFKFAGNHVISDYTVVYDNPVVLPDTVVNDHRRSLIDSLRPVPLTLLEEIIYRRYDEARTKPAAADSTLQALATEENHTRQHNDFRWDKLGRQLVRSLRTENEHMKVRLSPIINPQYISYSHRRGLSYRLKLGFQYEFNQKTSLTINPKVGYSFKLSQLYFTLPVTLNYLPKYDAHANIIFNYGERIYNSTVIDRIISSQGDSPALWEQQLDMFNDNSLQVSNYIKLGKKIGLEAGLMFHQRRAINAEGMKSYGQPDEYRSLAPMLGLKVRPWKKGPMFSVNYEWGLKGDSLNIQYRRLEADASMKHKIGTSKLLNFRLGGGVYTAKRDLYFLDFSNFRDKPLPEGWDDDWSGSFQLLSSRHYNMSQYYVRGNVSFDSPLLAVAWLPVVGRYLERERIYANSLLIEDKKPYSELGYGFTTRYVSIGLFASFWGLTYERFGAKFTFELFRRW